VTHPLSNTQNFDIYLLIEPKPWELAKKVQYALIGSRPRAFQRAVDEPCTLPLSPPKGNTKREFAIFSENFNFCRKTSAVKFLCVKTSFGKVVATSFLYLMVRWIAGDVHIYQKFALKVTHPSENADFDRFRLTVPQPWELQLSLIESWQRAFYRAIDEPGALPRSPPKGGSYENFYIWRCLSLLRRHFLFGMWVGHSKSQPTDDRPSLKWAWPRHVTHFKFFVPLRYLWNGLS